MLQSFKNFISEQGLFSHEHKLLLALSGGADSVCLFHLLHTSGFNFSVAHCNFKLRGAESDADEQFIIDLAKSKNVTCHTISFDTATISLETKTGIQETARKLRYDWFSSLMKEQGYYKLLTAHHQTDNLETMVINILRSTGIRGLHGIPLNENKIARPLMFTTRSSIEAYLSEAQIVFREDSSNNSDNYLRNELRHFVLPQLGSIQSDVEQRFFDTAQKVKSYEAIADELIMKQWDQIASLENDNIKIDISKLDTIENKIPLMYYNLQQFGFTFAQLESIVNAVQVGKRIISEKYELVVERGYYVISPLKKSSKISECRVDEMTKDVLIAGQIISFEILDYSKEIDLKKQDKAYLNADLIKWPLRIRLWRDGDKLKPLGMTGYKKVSDILTDKKVANHLRKDFLVIENVENEILALLPNTIHAEYKIEPNTGRILSIGIKIADS